MEEKMDQEVFNESGETIENNMKANQGEQVEKSEVNKEEKEFQKKNPKKGKNEKEGHQIQEMTQKIAQLEELVMQKEDQYLRLHAEFDNYRKRTLKEKMELTKSATSSLLLNIITVVDDFDRAMQVMDKASDLQSVKDGFDLIYKRFSDFLKQNGVSEIEAKEKDFDTDLHDAITKIPAPSDELKGKVVDVIQKGYFLNEKVIRFAKVVVGE